MNLFEKIIESLRVQMEKPVPYGNFHLISLLVSVLLIIVICLTKNKKSERSLRFALGTYGFVSLVFEIIKQLLFSTTYDATTNTMIWDFQWYAFPFQFCSTPMYSACIACFLKDSKIRRALIGYLSFFTILGGLMVMLVPTTIYTSDAMINLHTTILHAGGLVLSLFLLIHGHVKLEYKSVLNGLIVFGICLAIANILNISIFKSGVLNGETFDMFFISPYFTNDMPVFSLIEKYVSPNLYIALYGVAFLLGSTIVYFISYGISTIYSKLSKFKLSHAF